MQEREKMGYVKQTALNEGCRKYAKVKRLVMCKWSQWILQTNLKIDHESVLNWNHY